MYEDYFVMDIETCPLNMEEYDSLDEEEKLKKLNPIDSKIIAIGIRYDKEDKIFLDEDEKKLLTSFWEEWKKIKEDNPNMTIVGFNINNFDMPFLVSRSFINNVEIVPFTLKYILDVREKLNAYRYGKTKGKLSDYGKAMNLELLDMEGSDVARLCKEKDWETLTTYLKKDLEITDEIFKRLKETNIIHINKW
jgi:uncharacterized protein